MPGLDQTVNAGTLVKMNGSASFDPDNAPRSLSENTTLEQVNGNLLENFKLIR